LRPDLSTCEIYGPKGHPSAEGRRARAAQEHDTCVRARGPAHNPLEPKTPMMNTSTIATLALLLPLGLWTAHSAPQDAKTPPATAVKAPAKQAAPAGTYEIDPVHSAVVFNIEHMGTGRFWGRFNQISGKFVLDPAKPQASSVLAIVAAESVDTANDGRDTHLRGPDFFNAKEFPEIIFESKQVETSPKGLKITGDFTLLGKTKPMTVEAEYIGTNESPRTGRIAGYQIQFSFKRSDYGMNFMVGEGLGDEVNVVIGLEGKLAK
jgi:polyisoprenoid-binding protein YceI